MSDFAQAIRELPYDVAIFGPAALLHQYGGSFFAGHYLRSALVGSVAGLSLLLAMDRRRVDWWMVRMTTLLPGEVGASARAAVATANEFIGHVKNGESTVLDYVPGSIMNAHRKAAIGHIVRTVGNAPGSVVVTLPSILYDPTATPEKVAAMNAAYEASGSYVRTGVELIGPAEAAREERCDQILQAVREFEGVTRFPDIVDWRRQSPDSSFAKLYRILYKQEPGVWDSEKKRWNDATNPRDAE